tara:strand:+ start:2478 stop:3389 length:912 start_codon:yes stop_codon:yes gene_type:complete
MSVITNCDKLLKIYTNKCKGIFESAGNKAHKYLNDGLFGIIYDDFNTDTKLVNKWKEEYHNINIYTVTELKKTIKIDDKIHFSKKMSESLYTPESYLTKLEVSDKDALYFLKPRGGAGGINVNIYSYDELQHLDVNNSVIQKCCFKNPDLYNNRNYKIRQLVLLNNKSVYLHKENRFTLSEIDYDDENITNRKFKYIISHRKNVEFDLCYKIEKYDLIFENIKLAVKDFKKYYSDEINSIESNEYTILGFDFVVDSKKNVQIIEINHRSNYKHPKSEVCVEFIKDMIILLANKNLENTKFLEI